ncbi:glycosyltransferase [Clostridiales bacterium AHG0011]|uniref:glycosyltransferase n=1 Tax=Enterocloster aldenensis TaxID=358742 RepID=UPI0022DF69E0|nr:glycosyltransferase [Clostridiales bacterium AHG0011]
METGLVSVIITTYKREFSMLQEAIDSVLAQTYPHMEIMVVDDNGGDGEYTRRIEEGLKAYPQITYIKLAHNSGAQAARNTGIMASHGEFIAFLDDDDLWEPDKLAMQVPCFEDPGVGLVFCQGYVFDDKDIGHRRLYHKEGTFKEKPDFNGMLENDTIGTTSQAVVRKTVFDDCGMFDVDFPARQDYEMWLRILKRYGAAGIDVPLFNMRVHDGERITSDPMRGIRGYQKVYKKYKKDFRQNRTARTNLLNEISWRLWKQAHRYPESILYAVRLFFVNPGFVLKKGPMGKLSRILKRAMIVLVSLLVLAALWQKIMSDQNTLELSFYHVKSGKVREGFRIIQLSDLHLKEFGENNQELVERVKILEPDIIAITGDMNMEQNDDYHVVLDLCRQLVEITDVYYVMGNHELVDYAHRRTRIREDIEKTGVHMLFNHAEMIQVNTNDIYIGGLINEPYNYVEYGGKRFMDEYVRSEAFKLLLVHYPEYFMGELEDMPVDLALCGHAHGGIVRIPYLGGVYATDQGFFPPLSEGQHEINDSVVIISRGLGQSHPFPRINNKPEIVVVDVNWY